MPNMPLDALIQSARTLAYDESSATMMPIAMHIDLATNKAIELAQQLHADTDIVQVGTLMMDCLIGQAIAQGRAPDHVDMCHKRTVELLETFPDVSHETKENIEHCVLEHHGTTQFYSIESEICCNADCYRFISVKGFTIAIRYLRDMPFDEMIKLVATKVDEKWHALTLDICKKELAPEYETICAMLARLR